MESKNTNVLCEGNKKDNLKILNFGSNCRFKDIY